MKNNFIYSLPQKYQLDQTVTMKLNVKKTECTLRNVLLLFGSQQRVSTDKRYLSKVKYFQKSQL